ncbi:MAG: Teichoic acid translocation permease protein TagG [Owenweeksia sp. TMED14]|nr:MAG: Teichoic acid translocation permease protein TagG [Owenweeksia sp. TMED14]
MNKKIHSVSSSDSIWKFTNEGFRRTRQVTWAFARRDLQLRYIQTRLGWFWSIGQPLLAAILVLFFFSWIIEIEAPFGFNYSIYAFACLPAWLLAQHIIMQGSPSLVHNQHIISKVSFPRQSLPLSKALVALVDYMVATILYFLFRGIQSGIWDFYFFNFLFYSFATILASLGIAYWIAAISIRFRDWLAILPLLIQGLFLLSPIVYPTEKYSNALGEFEWILYLNPFVAIADGFRWTWLGINSWSELHYISFLMIIVIYFSGYTAIRYSENKMVDTL